jgi:hypothetical protein
MLMEVHRLYHYLFSATVNWKSINGCVQAFQYKEICPQKTSSIIICSLFNDADKNTGYIPWNGCGKLRTICDSRSPSWNLNRAPSERNSEALLLQPTCSVLSLISQFYRIVEKKWAFNLPSKLHFFHNLQNSQLPSSICASNEVRFEITTSCYWLFQYAVIQGVIIPLIALKTWSSHSICT